MIDWSWISTTASSILMVLLSAGGIYLVLLALTRLQGLRSFSKMSSFDFAMTVAVGSLIASTLLTQKPPLMQGVAGLVALYGIQYVVSRARRFSRRVERLVDNEPLLVMDGERILHDSLDTARLTEDDLRAKLRGAGVTHPSQVLAVVMETTGQVSVLKVQDEVDPWLFERVRGSDEFRERWRFEAQQP
jgi:uncharacterized membrane protein YcaP (DUF421 family)